MRCWCWWCAVTLFVLLNTAASASAVTLETYLQRIQRVHPFFEKEQLRADIDRASRDGLLGDRDWVATSSPYAAYVEPVENSAFAPERIYNLGINGALSRTYWGNGGRFSVSWQSTFSDQKLPGISIPGPGGTSIDVPTGADTFYQHRLGATYSLPLLQNRAGVLDRLAYDLAEYDVLVSEVQAAESQENFLLDVGVRFIDWAFLQEQVRIAEARLQFASEQLDHTQRRRRANLVDKVDVLRSQDAVQIAEERLALNRSRYRAKQAELAVLVRDEAFYAESPDLDLYALDSLPDDEEAVDGIPDQRLIRSLELRVRQLSRSRNGLENVTKPQLFLNLGGALQEGSDSFGNSLELTKPDLSVALDFRYPLGARAANAEVQKSRLQSRQLEKEIENLSIDLESQVRSILIELRELQNILALNRQQIETAREKTVEEQKLYNQGRSELTFVIQSRDSEQLAELTYAANGATYQSLYLQYRAVLDRLFP